MKYSISADLRLLCTLLCIFYRPMASLDVEQICLQLNLRRGRYENEFPLPRVFICSTLSMLSPYSELFSPSMVGLSDFRCLLWFLAFNYSPRFAIYLQLLCFPYQFPFQSLLASFVAFFRDTSTCLHIFGIRSSGLYVASRVASVCTPSCISHTILGFPRLRILKMRNLRGHCPMYIKKYHKV